MNDGHPDVGDEEALEMLPIERAEHEAEGERDDPHVRLVGQPDDLQVDAGESDDPSVWTNAIV